MLIVGKRFEQYPEFILCRVVVYIPFLNRCMFFFVVLNFS